ncbi:MAG: pitrilysin family protein [Pyrinomonadaceae bacterium]
MKQINAGAAIPAILLMILFASWSSAQTGKIENISEQASLVTEFEVNGLKVLLKRREAAPTVAVGLFIKGGSRNIDPKTAGIEHLTLNSAVEAGKKFPREAARREASRSGSSISAAAGPDFSAISLASTRQSFDRMWNVFIDVTLNPTFASPDVERVRQLIITTLRESEISPDAALESLEQRVVYSGHPYANDVQGSIKTVGSFTPDQLRAYHTGLMQTSRLLLVVVGDLDPDDLRSRVAASFGKLPRGSYKDETYPALNFSTPTLDIVPRNLQTNYIKGVFEAPSLSLPDYYPMRVAITILQQLVNEEVRTRRQLSYAPNAELSTLAANTANIYVTAVDANQAVSVMLDQINALKTRAVSQDNIDGMMGQFLTQYYLQQETNASQVIELARYELIGGGWRRSFEFLNRIREVKSKDIRDVSEKYMKNIRFVVVGNQLAIKRSIFVPE